MPTRKLSASVFREGWPTTTVATLAYCVCEAADAWGLFQENAALIAAALTHPKEPVSEEAVREALDTLERRGTIVRYEVNEVRYAAFVNWARRQTPKYFPDSGPNCPLPPVQTFRKLERKTQQNFARLGAKLSRPVAVAVNVAVSEAPLPKVPPQDELPSEGTDGCAFCRKPTKGPLQWFHDRYREVLERCPVGLSTAPKRHAAQRARWAKELGEEKLRACFELYLRSEDRFVVDAGHPLGLFWSQHTMSGLVAQLEAKERKAGADKRRRERDAETQRELEGER